MSNGLPDYALRQVLNDEIHARPFAKLTAPERATHLAMLSGEGAAEADRAQVARLCARYNLDSPDAGANHAMIDCGTFRMKWERHTEFSTYTFFQRDTDPGEPFVNPVIDAVPQDWLDGLPGKLLAGVHVELEPLYAEQWNPEALVRLFGTDNIAGSTVASAAASVWMDFAIHEDGFGRILLRDRHLQPRQAGRLVQRLLEIETYRMMALLALPLARQHSSDLAAAGEQLTGITSRMTTIEGLADERQLLDELAKLSAKVEGAAAATNYRFSATRAYYALVRHRIEELREERIEGFQTVAEFVERRLAPAMRTCEAMAERLRSLSNRVTSAGQMLRTRVDIELEAQNSALLRSMDRRARLQLRLQQTVEGLSVAAISYYLVGLVSYAAKAGHATGLPIDVDIATGLAIPVVIALVWFGVWRVRRFVERDAETGPETHGETDGR